MKRTEENGGLMTANYDEKKHNEWFDKSVSGRRVTRIKSSFKETFIIKQNKLLNVINSFQNANINCVITENTISTTHQ